MPFPVSSFLTPEGRLALRLRNEARAPFLETHDARLGEQHGRVMKAYVEVPEAVFAQEAVPKPLFEASCRHVASRKPKPTRP